MGSKSKGDKLEKRRKSAIAELRYSGIEIDPASSHERVLRACYERYGRTLNLKPAASKSHLLGYYSAVSRWKGALKRGKLKPPSPKKAKPDDEINPNAFYRSYEWRQLRYSILLKYGRRCMCCGQTPAHGVTMHVDHIKSLRKNWDLRLDADNLQVLCEVCNHGKGNSDETDWRNV